MDEDARYLACIDLIVVMQDLSHRLINIIDEPKLNLLDVCLTPEGVEFDEEFVKGLAGRIEAKMETCDKCCDRVFTMIWFTDYCILVRSD